MNVLSLPEGIRRFALADLQAERWRNGGGTTVTVAASASEGDMPWTWRVSVADIEQDGPFSSFPGVDRHLTLMQDGRVVLRGGGRDFRLERRGDSAAFPGEQLMHASLEKAPAKVLNVMWRRRTHRCKSSVFGAAEGVLRADSAASDTLLVLLGGSDPIVVSASTFEMTLSAGEGVWCGPRAGALALNSTSRRCAASIVDIVETAGAAA